MRRIRVGIVDYGIGNHASVNACLQKLGMSTRVSSDPDVLAACDVTLLPGVGAFRPAMEQLEARGIDRFLRIRVEHQRPVLGICLGMQLLCDASHEGGLTRGLGVIPGEIVPLADNRWHIGWNTVERVRADLAFDDVKGADVYFNHRYRYSGDSRFEVCTTTFGETFASVVRRGSALGVQFHPEKSQDTGKAILRRCIEQLVA